MPRLTALLSRHVYARLTDHEPSSSLPAARPSRIAGQANSVLLARASRSTASPGGTGLG